MDLQNAKLNDPHNAGGCANPTASDPETICLDPPINNIRRWSAYDSCKQLRALTSFGLYRYK